MLTLIVTLISLASPWLLHAITEAIKRAQGIQFSPDRVFLVRFALALVSLIAAVLHAILSGTPVPVDAIQGFAEALNIFLQALFIFLATSAVHFFKKQ